VGITKEEEISELRRLNFEGLIDFFEEKGEAKVALLGIPVKVLERLAKDA